MKWYVVHVFADYELKIKDTLLKLVENNPLQKKLGRVLVPTQKSFHIRNGKRVEREKKIFSNYIIIEADLVPELFNTIIRINGVTKFLGSKKTPFALSKREVDRILGNKEEKSSTKKEEKYDFVTGEMVKITSGPFTDFTGTVEKILSDVKKLNVNVTVFGRITPVELSLNQVEKIK